MDGNRGLVEWRGHLRRVGEIKYELPFIMVADKSLQDTEKLNKLPKREVKKFFYKTVGANIIVLCFKVFLFIL